MVKKPKLNRLRRAKQIVPEVLDPRSKPAEPPSLEDVPKITNETIAEHREQVLKGARKFIYPLAHSKRTIIIVTVSVIITAIIGLLAYCSLGLYRYYQYNTFIYRVTQVVPFPIAKAGKQYVSYENYLFELRHYVHYYQSQQEQNFSGTGRQQLIQFRKQALDNVINQAYIKKLASKQHVSVSGKEVDMRLAEVRAQNRLGGNDKVFEDVLRSYWGWSINDFKRSLAQQILTEKVAAALDTAAQQKAASVVQQAKSGADFTALAKQYSDDPTAKDNGGDYGFAIAKTNPNVPPEVVNVLFGLKAGQVSDEILASPVLASQGASLQIVKLTAISGNTVTAQHIVINLKDISGAVKALEKQQPPHPYVHL
jgi:parvulin-like peptidyl-prolyl isomerase